jgi:hypothetical protein
MKTLVECVASFSEGRDLKDSRSTALVALIRRNSVGNAPCGVPWRPRTYSNESITQRGTGQRPFPNKTQLS